MIAAGGRGIEGYYYYTYAHIVIRTWTSTQRPILLQYEVLHGQKSFTQRQQRTPTETKNKRRPALNNFSC